MSDPAQAMSALQFGQEIRLARARVRKDVGAGRRTVADALGDPCCATARVLDVLMWQHRWGVQRAQRFLLDTKACSPVRVAGDLTDRQRVLIARAIRLDEQAAA